MTDKYNGWTNWDTWNSYNWLTESEGAYNVARRATGANQLRDSFIEMFPYNVARRVTGPNQLRESFIEMFQPGHDDIDIDEVNWEELYESFNE